MSVLVPCRTLLPAYHKCYPNLVSQGKVVLLKSTRIIMSNSFNERCIFNVFIIKPVGFCLCSIGHAQ